MVSKALIIPAAGVGKRMDREIPKPFIKLDGKSILQRTISRFLLLDDLRQLVVATSAEYIAPAEAIMQDMMPPSIAWRCLKGGSERQDSIYRALKTVHETGQVLVHDAVRPFVQLRNIKKCCREARKAGAAVLGFPSKNTIKKIDENGMVKETPDRKLLWEVQTPQVFDTQLLKQAYEQAAAANFRGTDDASLVERLGKPVKVVRGSTRNIKITYPQDLQLARLLLKEEMT